MKSTNTNSLENNVFYLSLAISFLLHAVVIGLFSFSRINVIKKNLKQIEVTYKQIKLKKIIQAEEVQHKTKVVKNVEESKKLKLLSKDEASLPFMGKKNIKDISKLTGKLNLDKKQTPHINPVDISKQIYIPKLGSEKITNPKYLSYKENVRQKILNQAYRYIDHPDFDSAEISLAFVMNSQGALKEVKIISDKSKGSEFMKNIALRCIKEAAPYGIFPPDLNYPELPYNITIVFEVKK